MTESTLLAWLENATGEQTLIRGACFIGRSATSNLMLADDRVSRRHAMIQAQGPDQYWLIDLGSANGTYINGRRISQAQRLEDQDQIKIGASELTFRKPQGQPSACETKTTTDKTVQEIKTLNCCLLMADIEDSTNMIKALPPEEVPRITGRWLSDCKQILEEHGGMINKYLGDGFLAYWVEQTETAASVAKALALLKALQEQKQPRFREVVHYGSIVVGGSPSMGEESHLGKEVNFVFRMEKVAGGLRQSRLLSEPANNLLKPILATSQQSHHTVPGFEGQFVFFTF